jgi:hypothetical protein
MRSPSARYGGRVIMFTDGRAPIHGLSVSLKSLGEVNEALKRFKNFDAKA